jgi:hypothetical protein
MATVLSAQQLVSAVELIPQPACGAARPTKKRWENTGTIFAGRRLINQLCHHLSQTVYERPLPSFAQRGRGTGFLRGFYNFMTTTARPGVNEEENKDL